MRNLLAVTVVAVTMVACGPGSTTCDPDCDAGTGGGSSAASGGGTASAGGGSASTGGGSSATGGGTASTGGGSTATGGGSASTGGGTASTGGGSTATGGGTASTGGGSTATGGGTASTGGGSTATGGGTASTGGGSTASGGGSAPFDGGPIIAGLSKVGTGEYETLFLKDGTLYGYGAGCGLLGMGAYQGICIPARPVAIPTSGLQFIDVEGGLHQSLAIDQNGYVWSWGQIDFQGSGIDGGVGPDGGGLGDGAYPYRITRDIHGNAFNHVIAIEPVTNFNVVLKDDGTVWVWGNCAGGITGDGDGGAFLQAPYQVPLPAGVRIVRLAANDAIYAVTDDGDVWTWGNAENSFLGTGLTGPTDGFIPRKIPDLPHTVVDVAAGYASFQYALTDAGTLYGWGYRGAYLGLSDGGDFYLPTPTPLPLENVLNLPHPVVKVATDHMSTHVILTDGSLWGWGDDAEGCVGDGRELDYALYNYAWNYSTNLWVPKPVRIVPGVSNFTKFFAHSPFDFYDYALTADGHLYAWGRNKTGTIANGVYPLAADGNVGVSADMSGEYPNSWDVVTPTLVDPFTVQPVGKNSPFCVAHPDAGDCDN